jgi:hypothetical protein
MGLTWQALSPRPPERLLSFFYAVLFLGLLIFVGTRVLLHRDRGTVGDALVTPAAAPHTAYLWAWLLTGYLLLTFVPNKGEERYALPLLPPIALFISGAIMAIGNAWMRRLGVGLAVIIGVVNYVGLTYGLPGLPPQVSFNSMALISHEYPHYSWVRAKIPPTFDGQWPISAILAKLTELQDHHRARDLSMLRRRMVESAPERSVAEDVQEIYRVILGREPDKRRLQQYTMAVSTGQLDRDGLVDLLEATAKDIRQRARVLVVPDHPSLNVSTLRYYAEAERCPLSFFHILDSPIDAERIQQYDFVLVKSSGYQGPEFSTQNTAQIQAHVTREDSGFVRLPQRFAFPDDADIVIFAAKSMLP